MTNRFFSLRFLLFGSVLLSAAATGQTPGPDSLSLLSAVGHAKEIYLKSIAVQSHLYNGVRYKEWDLTGEDQGNPFFLSDDWMEGSINYDNEVNDNAFMLFDIVNDKVIVEHGVRGLKLQLIDSKIKWFTVQGHHFVHLVSDSIKNSPIPSGYYDLLSDGRTKFFVKWHREHKEVIEDLRIHNSFRNKNSFYIWKDGYYFQVQTKSSVLKVLRDNKSLRKFIRKNKINFHENRAEAIARVVTFYNESGE